jgi:hypothetical protein
MSLSEYEIVCPIPATLAATRSWEFLHGGGVDPARGRHRPSNYNNFTQLLSMCKRLLNRPAIDAHTPVRHPGFRISQQWGVEEAEIQYRIAAPAIYQQQKWAAA